MINCKFSAADRTPIKRHDSGFIFSSDTRRAEKPELISTGNLNFLFKIAEVKKCTALALFSDASTNVCVRPITPEPCAGTVIKYFPEKDKLIDEANGYALLKSEQGYSVPFCYGIYDCEEYVGKFLLAERIKGYSLDAIDETTAVDAFEAAVHSLARIHTTGFSHGDISTCNIMYSPELRTAIFVDLESVR